MQKRKLGSLEAAAGLGWDTGRLDCEYSVAMDLERERDTRFNVAYRYSKADPIRGHKLPSWRGRKTALRMSQPEVLDPLRIRYGL
jgi:hypothetical protein